MSKVLKSEYSDDLSLVVDYKIESGEFQKFKDRVLEQIAKTVEVKGFRKGKAPIDKALKAADQKTVAENLMKEILDKFGPEAIEEAKKKAKEDKRVILTYEVDYNPEFTKENEDGSYQIRLITRLFAPIDLSPLEKIKVSEITAKDVTGIPTFKEFKDRETAKILLDHNEYEKVDKKAVFGDQVVLDMSGELDGNKMPMLDAKDFQVVLGAKMFLPVFEENVTGTKEGDKVDFDLPFPSDYHAAELKGKTAKITVKVKEVKSPKYKTVEELVKNSEKMKENYKSIDDLDADIKKVFDDTVTKAIDKAKRKVVITETLKNIKDFVLPSLLLDGEIRRIVKALEKDTEEKGITLVEAFMKSGIPGSADDNVKKYDKKKVEEAVNKYVFNELKLTQILAFIYETVITDKPKPEEIEKYVDAAVKNPEQYKITKDQSREQIHNSLMDRVVRQVGGDWLVNKFFPAKDSDTKDVKSKAKPKKK